MTTMLHELAAPGGAILRAEQQALARDILQQEAQAILQVADQLGESFCAAAELLWKCSGSAIVCGIGKAGIIGQKLSATFASTGTRSHFLHPAEAMHGDLGRVRSDDCLVLLSYSGETEEMLRVLPHLLEIQAPLIVVTGQRHSTLARHAHVVLEIGPFREACPLGLAPSTSTTCMLALGDALALVVSRLRKFGPHDFARHHPGGSLGRQLTEVDELMRPLAECRVASCRATVREVFVKLSRPGRRTGAIMLVDAEEKLVGIFTDSDLARLFEQGREAAIGAPIEHVMTCNPLSVTSGASVNEAWRILSGKKISELPVLDAEGHPLGMIDITDTLSVGQPRLTRTATSRSSAPTADEKEVEPTVIPFPTLPLEGREV
jgi:arabinose-5-phosphate isomerase